MSLEHSGYDKGRTGTAQILYQYSATVGQARSPYQDYITGHGPRPTGHVVWTPSAPANLVAEPITVWSMSSDSFFLSNTISLSKVGRDSISFTSQSSEHFGRYGLSGYIYTSGYTLTDEDSDANADRFVRDEQFFLSMRDELLKNDTYRDKFVAILDGKLIDSDSDKAELARRCYRKFGYVPIYFDKVERIKRIVRIPSPRKLN